MSKPFVDTEKKLLTNLLLKSFSFSLIPTPIWRVNLFFFVSRCELCVCVSTILESPPIMGNLGCDWTPMSNRSYLV
jgi:hypothetical protein